MLLAGENAGRFAENLESMYDTAGLVASAAATVTTNTERLGTAIRNAGSTIGSVFEPAVQDVAGILADMINSLSGNRDRAREVETAFGNLMTASDDLRMVQEGTKKSTDELTAALEAQASATYHSSLLTFVESYNAAADDLDDVRKKISDKYKGIEDDTATFNEIMEKYGENTEFFSDAYSLMLQGYGSADISSMMGKIVDVADIELWHELSGAVQGYEAEIEGLRIKEQELAAAWSEYTREMTEAIRTGKVGISDLMSADYDLYQAVMALNDIYTTTFDNVRAEAESLSLDEIRSEIEEATRAISDDGILTNEAYEELQAKIDALQTRFIELTGERYIVEIEPTVHPAGGSEGGTAAESAGESITIPVSLELQETPESVIKELSETMLDNGRLASIMGDSFNLAEADIAAMTDALRRLVTEFDLDDSNESVRNLIDSLELLGVSFDSSEDDAKDWTEKLSDWLKELGDEMAQWATQAATSFAQSVGSGIEDLVVDLMTIDEQVEALNEQLADAEQEQLERNQELAEAEQEYADALLLGNEAEIEKALENLELAQRTKKAQDEKVASLQDEIQATKDGTKAWESFGKSALLALADVLEGLGAQLAAQAVAQAISYNWVNAALATAGSVAAYVAAGLIRGWAGSYAEGGIVPQVAGVPSTGDQHIARVNPGELILTEAQQGNLAAILATQQAMIDARAADDATGPRSIVINLSGAEIIGLDSEEVGRAIYRNIRSLQTEGVIGGWR